jgi:hypothetical protein
MSPARSRRCRRERSHGCPRQGTLVKSTMVAGQVERATRLHHVSVTCPVRALSRAQLFISRSLEEMLSLDYGSDSENEDISVTNGTTSTNVPLSATHTLSKSTLNLPSPTASTSAAKAKKTKKIAVALPDLPKSDDSATLEEPPAKKPRLTKGSGAGVSSLLSMLPAPKQPANAPPPRVLGGGKGKALQFNAAPPEPTSDSTPSDQMDSVPSEPTLSLQPTSVARGRASVNLESNTNMSRAGASKSIEPSADFFALGRSFTYGAFRHSHYSSRFYLVFSSLYLINNKAHRVF